MSTGTKYGKIVLAGAVLALVATWTIVIGSLIVFQPSLGHKAMIVAGGAAVTEAILYAGAAYFGITLFKRIRQRLRFGRQY